MKTTVTDALYAGCEAVVKIAWLNGLWLLFTLLGGVLFGWAPSTAAMCAVIRKWLMGQKDVLIFPLFLDTYKKEFLKVNAIGLAFSALLFILSANYHYFFCQYELAVLCRNKLHAACRAFVYHRADVCVSPLCALPAPASQIYTAGTAVWRHETADDRLYADRVRICPLFAVYASWPDPILRPVFIWACVDVFCS